MYIIKREIKPMHFGARVTYRLKNSSISFDYNNLKDPMSIKHQLNGVSRYRRDINGLFE